MNPWIKRGIFAVAGTAVAVFLGIWLYTILRAPPDKLSAGDLDDRLSATTTVVATSGTDAPSSTGAPSGDASGVDGVWIPAADSEIGYRVKEVLLGRDTEGVGRTNAVTGELTIADGSVTAAHLVVDVASITSDSGRRDGQFRGRIMETSEFPTAEFTLTAPADFGEVPADGESVTVSVTGDLLLHGVTRSVTFDLTAQFTNGRVGVFGNIPVVFADYGIDNPSNASVTTGDDGLLEFVILFDRG